MNKIIWSVLFVITLSVSGFSDTVIGDWGHFVLNQPRVLLNNPDGKAFSVTIHVMKWPVPSWNKPVFKAKITDPEGKVITEGDQKLDKSETTINVPAGGKGVYRLDTDGQPHWISSTLNESVLWTGDPRKEHVFRDRFAPVFQCTVPRTWWFYVPDGVTKFSVKSQRSGNYMSQREDWGMFVITPRGQRIRALWGQPAITPPQQYTQDMIADVEVEPGAGGRFWSLEIGFGDSHNYSKPSVCLDGVPPYLARSPEEWFDPQTGAKPAYKIYDDDPFIQSARDEKIMKERWPNLQHFSPCPSLGDPDGVEILGDASFALLNPEGRDLRFRIGTYLPRRDKKDPAMAKVDITDSGGKRIFSKSLPMLHIHDKDGQPTDTLQTGKGVSVVRVTGVERWMSFTYPATPLVLMGDNKRGWYRFNFSDATARNWYFYIPSGTGRFSVRASAEDKNTVMNFAVCAPDRTMALIYDNSGEKTITVPAGLDGKIWHLRIDTASASRIITKDEPYQYQDMRLKVELRGVPGYLAPTWEQWFNPAVNK